MENSEISAKRVIYKNAAPYRAGRFYTVENKWFFEVRETKDQGPYINKHEAERELECYILEQEDVPREQVKFEINNLKVR